MTILPKKKIVQEKRVGESVENSSHHGNLSHNNSGHHAHTSTVEQGRGGARPKGRNSPPRWVALGPLDERIPSRETIANFENTERRESQLISHGGSKRARHRSSPHRHERSKRPVPRKHHRDSPSASGSGLQLRHENVQLPETVEIDLNSGDEYDDDVEHATSQEIEEREVLFEKMLKEVKGFNIKKMEPDGACLFRAVADQVYGDQDWHSEVRQHCMDYMTKNCDYFSQYITEDFPTYIRRKRTDSCHGNHVEMQAISELYNRNIEVYLYSTEPINTFHTINKTDKFPIRVSYHRNVHYNSVVDPTHASVGVGLGMPSLYPGLADKRLMRDALNSSENSELEKAMLEDKLRATDWEATNEDLERQVAHDSYLQWLKENEMRNRKKHRPKIGTSSSTLPENSPGRGDRAGASSAPPVGAHRSQHSPRQRSGSSKSAQNSPDRPDTIRKPHHSPRPSDVAGSSSRHVPTNQPEQHVPPPMTKEAETAARKSPSPPAGPSGINTPFMINPSASFIQNFTPAEYGISAWDTEEAILATVLAQSQQEYLDVLKKPSSASQDEDEDSS